MQHEDEKLLTKMLSDLALFAPGGAATFFNNTIVAANIPNSLKKQIIGAFTGDVDSFALKLVQWAENIKGNPNNQKITALAAILNELFEKTGVEDQRLMAALIAKYGWYKDAQSAEALRMRYQIPDVPKAGDVRDAAFFLAPVDVSEDLVLQSSVRADTGLWDVGFVQRGLKRVASVCRIEVQGGAWTGSGVLIAPALVLTNYHVLALKPGDDMRENARGARLRFGDVSAANGQEAEGKTFKTAGDNPVVAFSPIHKLDYAVLRVEEAIENQPGIAPAEAASKLPGEGDGIQILQHPEGKAMKLAMSANGVTKAKPDTGILQYVTSTAGGSSGSPCFDDDWLMVGIHHAERATAFGSVREGILYSAIAKEIDVLLR